ncbi:MAG: PadR family transcriptional regulator [Coriobacteriia bacterium]|nr:PadR family transcriptional regulator [Coriobacteriia bacterium]
MDNLSEMLKGVLEGMTLQVISRGEIYGYQIVKAFHDLGLVDVAEGTVYTILTRLERKRMVNITRRASEIGPPRKFYTLNARGMKELQIFWQRWEFVQTCVNELLDGDSYDT